MPNRISFMIMWNPWPSFPCCHTCLRHKQNELLIYEDFTANARATASCPSTLGTSPRPRKKNSTNSPWDSNKEPKKISWELYNKQQKNNQQKATKNNKKTTKIKFLFIQPCPYHPEKVCKMTYWRISGCACREKERTGHHKFMFLLAHKESPAHKIENIPTYTYVSALLQLHQNTLRNLQQTIERLLSSHSYCPSQRCYTHTLKIG